MMQSSARVRTRILKTKNSQNIKNEQPYRERKITNVTNEYESCVTYSKTKYRQRF